VVTEGNYLLLDLPEWRAVRAELDEVWFVEVDDVVRRARLVARHVAFGKSPADAERWVGRGRRPQRPPRRLHPGSGGPARGGIHPTEG
jgi:pantothenate kinase